MAYMQQQPGTRSLADVLAGIQTKYANGGNPYGGGGMVGMDSGGGTMDSGGGSREAGFGWRDTIHVLDPLSEGGRRSIEKATEKKTGPPDRQGGPDQNTLGTVGFGRNKKKFKLQQLLDASAGSGNQAYQTLAQVLAAQGKTDPMLFNQQVQGIERGTQGQQQALQGQLAQLGLQGSMSGQALGAAIGQSGVQQVSQAQAQENALAEERKRTDLSEIFKTLMIDPQMGLKQLRLQRRQTDAQTKAAQRAQILAHKKLAAGIGSDVASSVGGGMG